MASSASVDTCWPEIPQFLLTLSNLVFKHIETILNTIFSSLSSFQLKFASFLYNNCSASICNVVAFRFCVCFD